MDFGYSRHFAKDASFDKCLVEPFSQGREHRAPETKKPNNYNPFAADVYQTARILYAWLKVCRVFIGNRHGDLKIVQQLGSCRRDTYFFDSTAGHVVL